MNNFKKYIYGLLIATVMVSCTKDPINPQDQLNYVKVGEAVSSGSTFNVEFFAADSLFVGYNKVYLKITEKLGGLPVTQASLVLHPLMDMVTFSHACPFDNPAENPDKDGYFAGAVMFSMIGTNSWSLTVDVSANGKSETVLFPIDKVRSTNPVKKIVIIDSLSTGTGTWAITKYPVSIVEPSEWKVGNNPFEITVHKMASMMSFPCCTDLTFEITPEMPSMGHGSPNNVNPVSQGNGHYLGNVNFTMTGAWRINLVVKKGDRIVNRKAYFDVVF